MTCVFSFELAVACEQGVKFVKVRLCVYACMFVDAEMSQMFSGSFVLLQPPL